MNLADLLDPNDLSLELAAGNVSQRQHPDDPTLRIFNYTKQCQYSNHWTPTTRKCRGLIVSQGKVEARPFDKFFNYGEYDERARAGMLEHTIASVTDKMDGSLGILYEGPGGFAIATRGSFTSEQAIHATMVLRTTYKDFKPYAGFTYLFEILVPWNRIVVDYGNLDDLVLLAVRNVETGQYVNLRKPSGVLPSRTS